jgi:hypothetical protein
MADSLLSKIKHYYFKKDLQQQIVANSIKRKAHQDVKTVGILFDASVQEHREIVAQQAENLRVKGKKVRIFGFFNDKNPHEGTPYQYFTLKDLDWKSVPKKEATLIADFVKQPFDLLYTYVIGENKIIDYLTAVSQANFKAGYFTETHNESQLMIDIHESVDLRQLVRQIDHYLAKINKKHEVAATV